MNCAEWELRILLSLEGEADPAAAEHLRYCPSCASLAADLDKQTQALRTLPPEAAAVDYPALRTAAAREAVLRKRRRKVLAALARAYSSLSFKVSIRADKVTAGFRAMGAVISRARTHALRGELRLPS